MGILKFNNYYNDTDIVNGYDNDNNKYFYKKLKII